MKVYPFKIDAETKPSLDEFEVAREIIELRESGAPKDYKGFNEGEELPKEQILGIVLHGKDAPNSVLEIWNDVENEISQFSSVNLLSFKTETEYKNALKENKKYLDEIKWVTALKEKYEANDFTELKEALSNLNS